MPQPNDLSRSLVALDQNSTIIAVVELSRPDRPHGLLADLERLGDVAEESALHAPARSAVLAVMISSENNRRN